MKHRESDSIEDKRQKKKKQPSIEKPKVSKVVEAQEQESKSQDSIYPTLGPTLYNWSTEKQR